MMSLIQTLQQQLKDKPPLPFVAFMQQALYAPKEGYYSSALPKLGKAGDFITAPELTPLFGYTLAKQCQQLLPMLDKPSLFEFGAGSGALCVALLTQLELDNALPESYLILELSADLRQRQQTLIEEKIPHLADKVRWLDQWPEAPFNGIVLANEVLDAMPVHRFLLQNEQLLESHIGLNEQGELQEQFQPSQDNRLINYVKEQLAHLESPYLSEVNLFINDWIKCIYEMLHTGAVFLIDYGFPRHEYYHPDRHLGTLMCHYQHHAHTNPLIHVGEQDITAHVDFTHVAEAGQDAGFHVAGYTNQASFLLSNGLLSLLSTIDNEAQRVMATQAIKQLTHPSEMGELFKVIALTKNLDIDLNGFLLNDKRVSL